MEKIVYLEHPRDYYIEGDRVVMARRGEDGVSRVGYGDWPHGFHLRCYPMVNGYGEKPVGTTEKRIWVPRIWLNAIARCNTKPDGTPLNAQEPHKWARVGYFLFNRKGNDNVTDVLARGYGAMEPMVCSLNVVRVIALAHGGRYAKIEAMDVNKAPPNTATCNQYTHPHLWHTISYTCRDGEEGHGIDIYPVLVAKNPLGRYGPWLPMDKLSPGKSTMSPSQPGEPGHDPIIQSVINKFSDAFPMGEFGAGYFWDVVLVRAVGQEFANFMAANRQLRYFASNGPALGNMNVTAEEFRRLQPHLVKA